MSTDPKFPLGETLNRPKIPDLVPVPGRPGWWRDKKGVEHYVEPVKPPVWAPLCVPRAGLSPAVLHAAAAVKRSTLNQLAECWRARNATEQGGE